MLFVLALTINTDESGVEFRQALFNAVVKYFLLKHVYQF